MLLLLDCNSRQFALVWKKTSLFLQYDFKFDATVPSNIGTMFLSLQCVSSKLAEKFTKETFSLALWKLIVSYIPFAVQESYGILWNENIPRLHSLNFNHVTHVTNYESYTDEIERLLCDIVFDILYFYLCIKSSIN